MRERFSDRREDVSKATAGFFGNPAEMATGAVSPRATFRTYGPFRFIVAESSTNYQIALTPRDIANAPSDRYGLYLQLSGETI